jgi:hypothetical protein
MANPILRSTRTLSSSPHTRLSDGPGPATQDLGVRKIQVTTDCLVILQALEQGSLASYSSVLKEICDRQHQFIESKVVHERRNSNVEAHNFARSSVALQPGRHVWLGSSPDPFFVPKRTAV